MNPTEIRRLGKALKGQASMIRNRELQSRPETPWSTMVALIALELGERDHDQEVAFEAALLACRSIKFRFVKTPTSVFRRHEDLFNSPGTSWISRHGGSD